MQLFYKIPILFEKLLCGEKHSQYDFTQSIKNFIDLIILTSPGEFRRDPTFGCEIWNNEFDILPIETKWQMQIKKSIEDSLKIHEYRLENISVDIGMDETDILMKKIDITVKGIIKLTGEPILHQKVIYLCPKSVD